MNGKGNSELKRSVDDDRDTKKWREGKITKILWVLWDYTPKQETLSDTWIPFLSSQELEMKVYNVCSIAEDEFLTVNKH